MQPDYSARKDKNVKMGFLFGSILLVQTTLTVSLACGEVTFEDVTFGFNGGYKAGKWAPLNVTVRSQNEPATFTGELAVEVRNFFSGALIQRYATPLQLSTTDRRQKRLYVYCPKIATKLVIQLVPGTVLVPKPRRLKDQKPPTRFSTNFKLPQESLELNLTKNATQEISPQTPIARQDYFVLALAPSGDKLQKFIDKKELGDTGEQGYVSYLPNSRALPTQWIGYSAVDVMVIREVLLTERRVSKAQQTALLDWVQRGGTLVVSGGRNFNYLRGSFIEPFLPVELNGVETVNTIPPALRQQLGFKRVNDDGDAASSVPTQETETSETSDEISVALSPAFQGHIPLQFQTTAETPGTEPCEKFECIQFAPKAGCETLIGTAEQIYVAKRNFGDGQILCLAFDYNAPPFGVSQKHNQKQEQQVGETFWRGLLSRHGKSPRHLVDRYALALQHEEKIYRQFLSKMPTQVPLIKLLSIVLPIYLLSFGGFLFYFGKRVSPRKAGIAPSPKQKSRTYWIGSCLLVLLSVSVIAVARNVLPNSITADRLSILSVYPAQGRAHLQSYVSLRATGRTQMSIAFSEGTFIRQQEIERSGAEPPQKIGTLIQGSQVQLRALFVGPWHPTTYVKDTFLTLDAQELSRTLEHKWRVTGKEMTYLGNATLGDEVESEPSTARMRMQVTAKMPPDQETGRYTKDLRTNPTARVCATISGGKYGCEPLPHWVDFSRKPY